MTQDEHVTTLGCEEIRNECFKSRREERRWFAGIVTGVLVAVLVPITSVAVAQMLANTKQDTEIKSLKEADAALRDELNRTIISLDGKLEILLKNQQEILKGQRR